MVPPLGLPITPGNRTRRLSRRCPRAVLSVCPFCALSWVGSEVHKQSPLVFGGLSIKTPKSSANELQPGYPGHGFPLWAAWCLISWRRQTGPSSLRCYSEGEGQTEPKSVHSGGGTIFIFFRDLSCGCAHLSRENVAVVSFVLCGCAQNPQAIPLRASGEVDWFRCFRC